ncbi:MAG: hypothetical protein ABI229_11970, partial [Gemmatimonadaceae bacterium]
TPITDINVHQNDLVLSTQGRSFWIMDNLTPLQQWGDATASSSAHLFAPRAAYRLHYRANPVSARGNSPSAPESPTTGAMIDYYFAQAPSGDVRLDILDASGSVVRSFNSSVASERTRGAAANDTQDEELAPRRRGGSAIIPKHSGLNRFTWDLTYPGPRPNATAPTTGGGPVGVPGSYRVRLTVAAAGGKAGWTETQPLTVKADPRITRDGVTIADMREQFDHNMRVRDLVSDVNVAVAREREARARLKGATGAGADTLQRLSAIAAKLETPPIRYSKPELQDNITYLYGMTNDADQKIGRDAVERYHTLRTQLDTVVADLNSLLGPPMNSHAVP